MHGWHIGVVQSSGLSISSLPSPVRLVELRRARLTYHGKIEYQPPNRSPNRSYSQLTYVLHSPSNIFGLQARGALQNWRPNTASTAVR